MREWTTRWGFAALVTVALASGCGGDDDGESGSVCDRAQEILEACGITGQHFETCTGDEITYARCTVDHEGEVCEGITNAADLTNGFNECVSQFSSP